MISYQEASLRLGIPKDDLGGFIDYVANCWGGKPVGFEADNMEEIVEGLGDGKYQGSLLERMVLEERLSQNLPSHVSGIDGREECPV